MSKPITVAALVEFCRENDTDPADAIVLIDRPDWAVIATDLDITVIDDGTGGGMFGIVLEAPDERSAA